MIEKIDLKDPHVIGFRIKGKIDDVSFKRSTYKVLKAFERDSHFNIYMEVESFEGVTFETIWDSIKLGLNHFGEYLKQVDKIAVVTDIGWLKGITKVENRLISSIEEKVFNPGEREMAKVWVSA